MGIGGCDLFTSHVFLSFVNYERISTVLLLFLVGLLILMGVGNNADLRPSVSKSSAVEYS